MKETVSWSEKLVAVAGSTVAIYLIALVSYQMIGQQGAILMVPSMGASAVLLFAVPHGKLSQPWPLFGGHLISAVIGVACFQMISEPFVAAALAVGLAIGAMHITNSLHPPGGATALAAVIGGNELHLLGYGYLLSPVLINVLIIFIVAVAFNNLFPWRRYPASLMRHKEWTDIKTLDSANLIDKEAVQHAINKMDLVIDVTTEDLQQLFQHASEYARANDISADQVKLGHYYSNGHLGSGFKWSVRQIIDESRSGDPSNDIVVYRVVDGRGINCSGSCTRHEFASWANKRVYPKGSSAHH